MVQIKNIIKFLWLAIRPVSKLESAVGGWDVVNLVILIAYPTIGGLVPLSTIFENASLAWFAGLPILLLLIAGLKLQFRLDRYEKKLPKLEYRLLPFPQSGTRILSSGEDERQKGYAQIAIINKGGKVDDCIGTLCGIAAISNLKDKLQVTPLTFVNESLWWYGNDENITIPNDKVERFLNLAFIDQYKLGTWQLAIKGNQRKDYGVGWWKIEVVISSLSTQMEPLRIEVALGLGDREQPASGINLWPWDRWYKTRQKELQQVPDKEDSQP